MRNTKGQFLPGHKPVGKRKTGTKNRLSKAMFNKLAAATPAILDKLIEQAKGGDVAASKLILANVLPKSKTGLAALSLPVLNNAADITLASTLIVQAVAEGKIPLDHGVELQRMVSVHREIIETEVLEQKLIVIEEAASGN